MKKLPVKHECGPYRELVSAPDLSTNNDGLTEKPLTKEMVEKLEPIATEIRKGEQREREILTNNEECEKCKKEHDFEFKAGRVSVAVTHPTLACNCTCHSTPSSWEKEFNDRFHVRKNDKYIETLVGDLKDFIRKVEKESYERGRVDVYKELDLCPDCGQEHTLTRGCKLP